MSFVIQKNFNLVYISFNAVRVLSHNSLTETELFTFLPSFTSIL